MTRRIAHLDMDAFYASVELLRYPQLKGLPVVIGGARRTADINSANIPSEAFPRLRNYTGRGVITTATYAARAFGIGSAMGLMKAAQLCPDAILLPVDFDSYRHYSQAFKNVVSDIAPLVQNIGIDEVYIDFTNVPGGQREGGRVLARLIQKTIFDTTGLTCSIGVAPNKLLAKMASELNKPNGISILYPEDIQAIIWPLPCRKINGVGPKADKKLQDYGINTIGELAACAPHWLIEHFGKNTGTWLHNAAWGRDDRPLETHSDPVTISRETTFERDLHPLRDRQELGQIFTLLCEKVAADLQRKGYAGRTIGIKLRDNRFKTTTRNYRVDLPIDNAQAIRSAAGMALKRAPIKQPLRLLGVKIDDLVKKEEIETLQQQLF